MSALGCSRQQRGLWTEMIEGINFGGGVCASVFFFWFLYYSQNFEHCYDLMNYWRAG